MAQYKNLGFFITLMLLLITIILSIMAYVFWQSLISFFVGSYLITHWASLIATIFIAVSNPIHYILKRKRPKNYKILLTIHVFGNLSAFLAVSIHSAQNIGRLSGYIYRLEDGFVSYLLLIIIVATGVLERYRTWGKSLGYIKVIHKYSTIILFFTFTVHVLEGFNILLF